MPVDELSVKAIIAEHLVIDIATVRNESLMTVELGADSLDMFEIIYDIETKFNLDIDINDNELNEKTTVADILALAERAGNNGV